MSHRKDLLSDRLATGFVSTLQMQREPGIVSPPHDGNVLIRPATQDDPRQAAAAAREIEGAARREEKLLIQPLVFCELVRVLESAYGVEKEELLSTLEGILRNSA